MLIAGLLPRLISLSQTIHFLEERAFIFRRPRASLAPRLLERLVLLVILLTAHSFAPVDEFRGRVRKVHLADAF